MKRLLALLLVLSALPLHAQIVAGFRDGRTLQLGAPAGEELDVIVEFREPPLFARERLRVAANAQQRAAAMQQFAARLAQFSADLGRDGTIGHTYQRVFAGASAHVSRAALARIRALGYVAAVHIDRPVHALLDDSVAKINANQVWSAYGTYGQGVVVAVIDTGIDYKHPALGGAFGGQARVRGGYDFVNKKAVPLDDNGHGTHVAGIIGANGNGFRGVAPEVRFLSYKVLNASGAGNESDVVAGVERAADPDQNGDPSDHADVVNMSLGNEGGPDDPVTKAVERATAAGVVFAIAAGNAGGYYSVGAPGNAPSAITVGASDLNDAIAAFSSAGPTSPDMQIKPEVVAPGVNILSLAPGGGTATLSGTSMAAPHVAGVAALLKSIHPDWTPAQIKSAIVSTAEILQVDVMRKGGGRVDALRAAGIDVTTAPSTLNFGRVDASQSQWSATRTLQLTNHSGGTLTLKAEWTGGGDGIGVTIDPATVSIGPGATQNVTVTVTADNAVVPFPLHGSLSFFGDVVFTGAATPIHVPWAFVKAAKVAITYDSDALLTTFVTGANGEVFYQSHGDATLHTFDIYVPPSDYQVLLEANSLEPNNYSYRVIFAPAQKVDGDTPVDLRKEMAATEVTYASTDEQGRLLSERLKKPGRRTQTFTLQFPPTGGLAFVGTSQFNYEGSTVSRFFTSAIPDGISLTGSENLWDGISTMYVAQFGPITPTGDHMTLGVTAPEWLKIPLPLVTPPGAKNPTAQLGATLQLRGASYSLTAPFFEKVPFSGGTWQGTIFLSPERDPSMSMDSAVAVKLTADVGVVKGLTVLTAPPIRNTGHGFTTWPYLLNGPTAYIARPDEPIVLGQGPIHPEVQMFIFQGTLLSSIGWIGVWDEQRAAEAQSMTMRVTNGNGDVVTTPTSLPPDVYKLEAAIPIALAGVAGTATLTEQIDSRLTDTIPPTLRSLRVTDSVGRQTAALPTNGNGFLRFAVQDFVLSSSGRVSSALVVPEKTAVSWRPHGASDWQPLTPVIETEELTATGYPPMGTVYACDLSAATRQGAGTIDVRIHAEDASGNAMEYTLAPAFAVAVGKRRAAEK
ncbi:MAG TPA: S8 family serine peptidase [Thermoanaerobaculia bacterium]|nr:S8 family serine peptidase [Thermoanaerobaculia bacterium]